MSAVASQETTPSTCRPRFREFVVDQADDADLLGGLFHDDEADHIVALEADALFLELRKDRAAVDLAGDATLGIGGRRGRG